MAETINTRLPDLTFLTECHPEAHGRSPQHGDLEYVLRLTLENGHILCLKMGQVGFEIFRHFVHQMAEDDAIDASMEPPPPSGHDFYG